MKCYEKTLKIPFTTNFSKLKKAIQEQFASKEEPIRFAIVDSDPKYLYCDLAIVENSTKNKITSIFDFQQRPFVRAEIFTAAMIVPTGIAAAVGGDSGDAQAAARLMATTCDRLITHPNVLNGADIMEAMSNTLYVEGSTLSQLMMGTIGLLPTRKNKILLAIDQREKMQQETTDLAINAASAARLGLGADIDVTIINPPAIVKAFMSESGRAIGSIENLQAWYSIFNKYKDDYDAFAISSVIEIEQEIADLYFDGKILVNPWGGIEAMLTHSLSLLLNKPIAHSPMNTMRNISYEYGIVTPEVAGEAISKTSLHCILKGLHQSPKILNQLNSWEIPGAISVADINCLIQPDRCIGLPTLAALKQGVPVIAVNDTKNIMKNDLDILPWKTGQLLRASNYLEAAGIVTALKAGISLDTVLRPVTKTKILNG